jgi:carbonic anhydrase/acetyltransferase-like protein (isoleucine patch superfamily)
MVQGLGVGLVSVVDRAEQPSKRIHTMVEWAREGVERILLIVLGSYAEIDLGDLVRFHYRGQHRVTRVFDQEGPLGISLLDRDSVLADSGRVANEPYRLSSRYDFLGYVIRLSSTVSYRRLVEDALQGRCAIRPSGIQAREDVWIDPSASLDPSVQIEAPCYIGPNAKLRAGVMIRGCSSIERDCEIDLGTTIDHASILPNTYVAPGLYVRESVVDGTRLENLARGVALDLGAAGLLGRISNTQSNPARPLNLSAVVDLPLSETERDLEDA